MNSSVIAALYGGTAIVCTLAALGAVYWYASRPAGAQAPAESLQQTHRRWVDALRPDGADAASPDGAGRHHIPDELLRLPTYRLSADRLARAKVPEQPEPTHER